MATLGRTAKKVRYIQEMTKFHYFILGFLFSFLVLYVPSVSAFGGDYIRTAANSLENMSNSLSRIENKLLAPQKCVPCCHNDRAAQPPTIQNSVPLR